MNTPKKKPQNRPCSSITHVLKDADCSVSKHPRVFAPCFTTPWTIKMFLRTTRTYLGSFGGSLVDPKLHTLQTAHRTSGRSYQQFPQTCPGTSSRNPYRRNARSYSGEESLREMFNSRTSKSTKHLNKPNISGTTPPQSSKMMHHHRTICRCASAMPQASMRRDCSLHPLLFIIQSSRVSTMAVSL